MCPGDSDVVAKDENGRCIDRPEDGPPRLVPASQQTYNQSPVRTAAVTAVSKPSTTVVTDDWSNLDHSYDSADNDRRLVKFIVFFCSFFFALTFI